VYSSDSEISVKISSYGEENVSSDEKENISDTSSKLHGLWAESGAEQPCSSFTGKPCIIVDL
jgi:hypothetical protein